MSAALSSQVAVMAAVLALVVIAVIFLIILIAVWRKVMTHASISQHPHRLNDRCYCIPDIYHHRVYWRRALECICSDKEC